MIPASNPGKPVMMTDSVLLKVTQNQKPTKTIMPLPERSNHTKESPRLSLQAKFFLSTASLLIFLTILISLLVYLQYRRMLFRYAYEQTSLLMAEAEAARHYVKEILRPKMYSILPKDTFIVEAMSTSFVTRKVMGKVAFIFKGMKYKRASVKPRNPDNIADTFERRMIGLYNASHSRKEWQGIVRRQGRSWFVALQPIYMQKTCLRCHGDPRDAPMQLISRYGSRAGFHRRVGTVAGLDEVAVPVDNALAEIHRTALYILAFGFLSVMILFIFGGFFFDRLVYQPLKHLADFCRRVETGEKALTDPITVYRDDEIGQLAVSFNHLMHHLYDTQQQLLSYSEGLESQVRARTKELHQSRNFLKSILATAPIGFFVINDTGVISLWNAMAERITGIDAERVVGRHFREVSLPVPHDYIGANPSPSDCCASGREYCFTRPGGEITHILVSRSLIPGESPEFSGIVINFIDITEMKNLHEELNRYTSELEIIIEEKVAQLRESEQRYREIFEHANDAIVFLDSKTCNVIDMNPRWLSLSGYSTEEMRGQPFTRFLRPYDAGCAKGCLEKSYADACSLEIEKKNGEVVTVELISSTFSMNNRKYVMSIIRDITTRRRLQEQLIRTNSELKRRNRALQDLAVRLSRVEEDARRKFAAILHDELGQDLTAIKINIGILHKQMETKGDEFARDLEKVQDLLSKVIGITRDLTSEMYPTILDNLGLVAALRWYSDVFTEKFGMNARLEASNLSCRLPQEIETLLFRLVQEAFLNCAKHSRATQVTVSLTLEDSRLTIKVADNGRGFDPKSPDMAGRNGMGLHIIRERMHSLGGRMIIDSAPGHGTTLTLQLAINRFQGNRTMNNVHGES